MVDDQKVVFETAMALSLDEKNTNKKVYIVEGGPGTGKSVLAINLLSKLLDKGKNVQYVTKNAAPRAVFESKLTGTFKKTEISNLFSGSGAYVSCEKDSFDVLIVDEAHRLNEKSGMFKNLGFNQVKEIIDAARLSIFFIDEDQKVTWSDIGESGTIEKFAKDAGADIFRMKLDSQFRCNGSDGYLAWLDNLLQIHETANFDLSEMDYDFKIVDSPNELRELIREKNKINNKARIVAGYCWNWVSKNDSSKNDIEFPDFGFGMKWNLATDGNLWITAPNSVEEAGCIHTCQGLEMDYVGVIIGKDLILDNNGVATDPSKRARTDKSLVGFKKELLLDPEAANRKADQIIRNTYRTLMTRGMKGCYVYVEDESLREFFKKRISIGG